MKKSTEIRHEIKKYKKLLEYEEIRNENTKSNIEWLKEEIQKTKEKLKLQKLEEGGLKNERDSI